MKAITIKQPWASLIVHSTKDVENRTWPSRYRGPILIHAGKAMDGKEVIAANEFIDEQGIKTVPGWPWDSEEAMREARDKWPLKDVKFRDLPFGGIVGVGNMVDCVAHSESPWFSGPWGFVIRDVRPVPFHACRGALGLWECDYVPPAL